MAFEAEGKLHKIFDTANITDTFRKRELVVEIEDGAYSQQVKFELVQDKCDILNDFNEGDFIKVSFNLRGRAWTPKDGGDTKYFNTLQAWRIVKPEAAVPPPANQAGGSAFPSAADEPAALDDDLPF